MAVSQIEYKILGRLAKQTHPSNKVLAQALYQVLGLSIQLNPKLVKARRLRKLDVTRDTKSLQLYHHIIWLAREGLAITEIYILPYCQNGDSGPECRVMAAKLRASLYHVFCLFHNHPPISTISPRIGADSTSSPSSAHTRSEKGAPRKSPGKSPRSAKENGDTARRSGKSSLRDPIPSMTSETSYVTNPYAVPAATPPPPGPPPPVPPEARRTPTRPPGLAPINISPTHAAASFLLPPLNFVPMAREHFETAQHLANTLLTSTHALRLSVSLDHAVFLWECEKEHERARKLARRSIKDVYSSTDGLDDDEFADASLLVQTLGGIVKKDREREKRTKLAIDRTIAVSPKQQTPTQIPSRSQRTPDRLSTVPEVASPSVSRMSNRSKKREEKRADSAGAGGKGRSVEGYVRPNTSSSQLRR